MTDLNRLNPPADFSFPFPPYEIQTDFMIALFNALEGKKLGIFESPTGTGKSLSLICGALTWLELHSSVHKAELKELVEESAKEDDIEDWFNAATKRIEKEKEKRKAKVELDKIEKTERRIDSLRFKRSQLKQKYLDRKKVEEECLEDRKNGVGPLDDSSYDSDALSSLESECLLEDYASDGDENEDDENDAEEDDDGCLKIFYCSRTHSQLSQFVREVQKTRFLRETRLSSLASRQNLCVNEAVAKLPSVAMINERCIDLKSGKKGVSTEVENGHASKKKKTSSGCPFDKQNTIQNLSDQVLLEVQDLEQLVGLGRKMKACPYYASRKSVKDSQLVVLPYNCLLHKGTREACGIKLKGNVVIVDEAHNLLETIGSIHSAIISMQQVCQAQCQLSEYLRRYEKRLSPKNLLYIKQILFVVKAYQKIISTVSASGANPPGSSSRLMLLQDFLLETLTDNLNLFKLVQYIEKSKIAHKLHAYKKFFDGQVQISNRESLAKDTVTTSSFLAKMAAPKNLSQKHKAPTPPPAAPPPGPDLPTKEAEDSSCGSPLLGVTEFLRAMTGGSSDGRVVVSAGPHGRKAFLKFLLLNPASQFHDIVSECRSVIVAGGTMAPVDEFRDQLFLSAGSSPERVVEFSCNHVVSEGNVLPLVVTKGPGAMQMDFTFRNRSNPKMLDELGRTLTNLCNAIPGGVVCFFPSYDYEEKVHQHFYTNNITARLSTKKKVFREPRKSNEMERVLTDYTKAVRGTGGTGAILFSVVGGKMSEGINFSDDLGRCVVMVGLPYPNSTSAELKEKMAYLNKHFLVNSEGKTAGACYYENLCFKAVNQSIGRSIRHRTDFASIVLLDHRYAQKSSLESLPRWISSRTRVCEQFGQAFALLRKFFVSKKELAAS